MPRLFIRVSRVLLVLTIVAVTYLSLSPDVSPGPPGQDKVVHLFAYLAVAFLLVLSARSSPSQVARSIGLVTATVAYGILIEYLQRFTGRQLDVADMGANAVGAVIGAALGVALRWLIARRVGTGGERPHGKPGTEGETR